jgi:cysteine desulfurase/selenocysteine lyase
MDAGHDIATAAARLLADARAVVSQTPVARGIDVPMSGGGPGLPFSPEHEHMLRNQTSGGATHAPGAGVSSQAQDGLGAQAGPSERRAGGPERTSGDGAWVVPTSEPREVQQHTESGIRSFVRRIRGLDHLRTDPPFGAVSLGGAGDSALPGLPATLTPTGGPFDVAAVRRDFPILRERIHGRPLVWLDNAATTQKPQAVIDALAAFYAHDNSNIHRGAHALAARATDAYERARSIVATFLGAESSDDIVFVRGCTEGINLVANILAPGLSRGDEIVVTELEHHANIVPWQMVAERTGAVLRVVPIDDRGDVIIEAYARLLSPLTRIVALSHASNSLGTILPVELMTGMAKALGARVLVDGAQSVSHFPVDVRRIGCDFYVFSGHKIFAPTGIGAVFMPRDVQRSLPPWQGGGNMIRDVTFARTIYSDPPAKFEAGTPNIADAIGLGAALDYVTALGRERIAAYEHDLLHHATARLAAIDGLRLVGTARDKVGVLSFVIDDRDPIEIGRALDREGIAVRAGHHCAQPSLRRYGLEATVRPSLAFYNTHAEIDQLGAAVAAIARRLRAR